MKRWIYTRIIPLVFFLVMIEVYTWIVMKPYFLSRWILPGENIYWYILSKNTALIPSWYFIGTFLATLGAISIQSIINNKDFSKKQKKGSRGSSKWATKRDIKKFGFLRNETGIILGHSNISQKTIGNSGTIKGKYANEELYVYDGPSNIMLIGSTRSGKGIGVILPTLEHWKESIVVLDLKGELARHTLQHRSKFSDVYIISPDNTDISAGFNPLDTVRRDIKRYDDLRALSYKIWPKLEGDKDFWRGKPRDLFCIIGYYLIEMAEQTGQPNPSIADIVLFLLDHHGTIPGEDFDPEEVPIPTIGFNLIATATYSDYEQGEIVKKTAFDFIQGVRTIETWEGHWRNFKDELSDYISPSLQKITKSSDFDIIDLISREKPITVYLVFNDESKTQYEKYIRLVFNSFTSVIMREENPIKNNKCLMLIDEFYQLGKMSEVEKGMAVLAGYGVQFMLVVQSIAMINQLYGRSNSLMDNCDIKLVMNVNDYDTAEHISKAIGTKTIKYENRSQTPGKTANFSETSIGRRLLDANEVLRLGRNNVIILGADYPIMAGKVIYFRDTRFRSIWKETPLSNLQKFLSPGHATHQSFKYIYDFFSPPKQEKPSREEDLQPQTNQDEERILSELTQLINAENSNQEEFDESNYF